MESKASPRAAGIRLLAFTLLTALSLFLPAGTLRWWNAWVFMGIGVALVGLLTGIVFRKSPELVQERATAASRAKAWDRVLVPMLAGVLPFLSNILAGLDRRLGWSTACDPAQSLAAGVVMLAGMTLTFRAMQANKFFSSHVRIQHDRGHTVVREGPYRFLRHPGYAGTILYNLAAPLLLGSLVALWVGVVIAFLFVVRTILEDRVLLRELPGYREYAARVRYRLVPRLW
jgi:protein-S-isoprenylcysteine O-methyltransferase Ste14